MVAERTCKLKTCNNPIASGSPLYYCYLHEQNSMSVTPKGQRGLRRTNGPASWQERLKKERQYPFPSDSADIDGYPFFTVSDLKDYSKYMEGDESYRPTSENILDRYPIQAFVVNGREIDGSNEVSIIDGNGKMHIIDQDSDVVYVEGMRSFSVNSGRRLSISDEENYQVVMVDDLAIAERAGALGINVPSA